MIKKKHRGNTEVVTGILTFIVVIAMVIGFRSCTAQQRAKNWGGSVKIDLAENQKMVMASWKDENLWVMTKPKTDADKPETYEYKEYSSFGIWQGTVTVKEHFSNP